MQVGSFKKSTHIVSAPAWAVILVVLSVLPSCFEEPHCLITATNSMKITFRNDTGLDAVAFVQVSTPGSDSVFYAGQKLSTITLPLNPNMGTTRFIFVHELGTDSLDVSYRLLAELVNPDCGTQVFYKNLTVNISTFSRVEMKSSDLLIADSQTRDVVTNLEIYR